MDKKREQERQRLRNELSVLYDRVAVEDSSPSPAPAVHAATPKLGRSITITGGVETKRVPEFERPPTHFFAIDQTNVDHMRPYMEEFVKHQADMGNIAMKMALVDGIVKAYESNALWTKIKEEGIWKFDITDLPSPITPARREWFHRFACQKEMAILCRLRQLELNGQYEFVTSWMATVYANSKAEAQKKRQKGIKVGKGEEFVISDEINNKILKALEEIDHKQFEFSEKLLSAFSKYDPAEATQWALEVEIRHPGIFGARKRTHVYRGPPVEFINIPELLLDFSFI